MLNRYYNLEEKRQLVESIIEPAKAYLNGKAGSIETTRALSQFVGRDRDLDRLLFPLVGVNSETDALPVGNVRKYWDTEALKQENIKIAAAEARYASIVSDACHALVASLLPLLSDLRDQHPKS